ncbi:MAG: 16S rRNA (cytosine(967)-C(5))-methyltransferase RsmB [Pseudomonadota bacterium]
MREAQLAAADAVSQVLAGASLGDALPAVLDRLRDAPRGERARAQDLAYGTLRHYGLLDAALKRLAERPPRPERLRALLLVALYQLEFSEGQPYAVVNEAVGAAADLTGGAARGFANAVLRNFQRGGAQLLTELRAADPVARYSHPAWWIDRLRVQYPDDFERLLEIGNGKPPMALRVNRRRATLETYLGLLAEAQIAARAVPPAGILLEHPAPVEQLPRFAEGWVSVQDLGAQHAAELLDLAPGMRVLDACAAPGGKAAHILEHAAVDLTAVDRDPGRVRRIEQNLQRLGLGARVLCADAGDPGAWWDGKPFQRVLLDAPCSASGVARRHPDVKWLRRPRDLRKFAAEQLRLLDGLWRALEAGGTLLYVTCSVFADENQRVVERFLDAQSDASLDSLPGRPDALWQLLPDAAHDGFFFARLAKR